MSKEDLTIDLGENQDVKDTLIEVFDHIIEETDDTELGTQTENIATQLKEAIAAPDEPTRMLVGEWVNVYGATYTTGVSTDGNLAERASFVAGWLRSRFPDEMDEALSQRTAAFEQALSQMEDDDATR